MEEMRAESMKAATISKQDLILNILIITISNNQAVRLGRFKMRNCFAENVFLGRYVYTSCVTPIIII